MGERAQGRPEACPAVHVISLLTAAQSDLVDFMDHAEGVHDALKAVEVAPEAPEVIRITHRRAKRPASRLPSDPSIITPPPPKRAGSKSKSVKTSSNGKTNSEKSHSALIFGVLALVVVVTLGLKYFEGAPCTAP